MNTFLLKRKIKKYTKRIAKVKNDPALLAEIAELHEKLSEPEHAVNYYQQAIETYYQENSRLGEHVDFILNVCWRILVLDPLNPPAHRTLGQEYCKLGEFDEAIDLYASFAKRLTEACRYEDALGQYRNILVLTPEDSLTHQKCFALLCKLRRKDEAVQTLQKIAEIAKKNKNFAKVVECYKKAVKIMPSNQELQAELRRFIQHIHDNKQPLRLVVNK